MIVAASALAELTEVRAQPVLTIRRAKPQDADSLSDCIDAAYSVYASRIADLPSVSHGIAQTIASSRVWISEIADEIVGGIILVPHEKNMVLENIAVRPDSSEMGVGAALIRQAETDCLEFGLHELRLSTHIDMPENVRLYEHLGWKETGRSGNKVLMSKEIKKLD